jgi:hypothetical protein
MGGQVDDDRIEILVFFADFARRALFDGATHERFGHAMAAWEATGATVAIGQHLLDVRDTRIFFDVKEVLSQDEENA